MWKRRSGESCSSRQPRPPWACLRDSPSPGRGSDRHRKQWHCLFQIPTAGGLTILYLSIYGAFGYCFLIDQRSASVFLAIVVVEAHLMAVADNAPSIAVMALTGGFLIPLLLGTGRDQYRVLFTCIGLLDPGVLSVVIGRGWRGLGSLAYAGTHLLFWGWYAEHYHPDKRLAALLFQRQPASCCSCWPTWRGTCAAKPPTGRSTSAWR